MFRTPGPSSDMIDIRRRRLLPLATGALAAYSWRGPVSDLDVIVVGAGNAALAAAVSAREQGAVRVLALEKAPRALRGGNTHYSGGLLRIAFDRAEDLRALVPDAQRDVPGFYAGVEPYPHRRFMWFRAAERQAAAE